MKTFLKIFISITLLFLATNASAQVKHFDKLEQLYAQQHYKLVYHKANKLLDWPEYDYSLVPTFYKSLSMFQLSRNRMWLKRNKSALFDAANLFEEIKNSPDGNKVLAAHVYEISALKEDLLAWQEELKLSENKETAATLQTLEKILASLFQKIPSVNEKGKVTTPRISTGSDVRSQAIAYAEKQIGVSYVWAGTTPKGFDCSGFTGYILKEFGINVPRRAVDQQKASRKVKEKNVQKGDLIFFNNGGGISHVGMVVSEKGEPIKMIHASSSKGVIITDLKSSDYWTKRIDSFGTYFD